MNGFLVTRQLNAHSNKNEYHHSQQVNVGDFSYIIESHQCHVEVLNNGDVFIFDGYTFPENNQLIIDAIAQRNFTALSAIEGHFSGLYIENNTVIGFNDRFGGKTLFWQIDKQALLISSRSSLMPIFNVETDIVAKSEIFEFRWTTAQNTLLSSIKQLKVRSYIQFDNKNKALQETYWQLTSPKHDRVGDTEKILATKNALLKCLKKANQRYKKVAVFLSGGVDSSILAALSKNVFEECYLITPIFNGEENPELENAKIFAKTLGLPLNLVEISPVKLQDDLECLIAIKREPLRHYSSLAMMAMMKAVPDGIDAVIYGEAADTLFGSNGIKRIKTHAHWKKQTRLIPKFALDLVKKITPGRGRVLSKLKESSLREVILSSMRIKYTKQESECLQNISKQPSKVEGWLWDIEADNISEAMLRHAAQERILTADAATHFSEAEMIAEIYGKHIISPFFTPTAIDIASTLTEQQYFGDNYVKPILRELACEFFPRELIYQKKHGFPVPFISWLNGPLNPLITTLKAERVLFDGRLLDALTVEENFEMLWLLINWHLLEQHLHKSCLVRSTT
jgi:asparagine synthase (glutamine-hydrolysing)